MRGHGLRDGGLRGHVLLVLLALALTAGHPSPTVLALGTLALAGAILLTRTPVLPPPAPAEAPQLRAWVRSGQDIARAEQPDRPGRPRPRAPAGAFSASER
jgi:hypothetical protein